MSTEHNCHAVNDDAANVLPNLGNVGVRDQPLGHFNRWSNVDERLHEVVVAVSRGLVLDIEPFIPIHRRLAPKNLAKFSEGIFECATKWRLDLLHRKMGWSNEAYVSCVGVRFGM